MNWLNVIKILLFVNSQPVSEAEQWENAVEAIESYGLDSEVILALAVVDTGMDLRRDQGGRYGAWKILKGTTKSQDVIDFCGLDPDDCAHSQAMYISNMFKSHYEKCDKDLDKTISAHKHGFCSIDKEYIQKVKREISYIKQLRNNYEVQQ